jgi:carboxypeptidase family protein
MRAIRPLTVVVAGYSLLAAPALAQTAALAGQVSSAEEGPMEGVVVSASKARSGVTVSVVSDAQGRYRFPAAKLASGSYSLRIRATGYELDGPATAEVVLAVTRSVDLRLRKVRDITPQMSNAEWIASFPGTPDQKKFLYGCVGCHTRRGSRQGRQGLDRGNEHRSRAAPGPGDGRVCRISAPEPDQHPPCVRRQLNHAAYLLGGEQSPRFDREGRADGVGAGPGDESGRPQAPRPGNARDALL